MSESTEQQITPYDVVRPLVTPEEARRQWMAFEALKQALLGPDDYQRIAGKQYIKRSGFRKIAVYFGLSDEIIREERTDREDGSFMWRIVVRVTAPNGRTSTGVGICDSRERSFAHPEHDVYATSHTRAKSRAISDMVAGGVVSAEEMEAPETKPSPTRKPPRRVEAQVRNRRQPPVAGHMSESAQPDSDVEKVIDAFLDQGLVTFSLITVKQGNTVWVQHPVDFSDEDQYRYQEALIAGGYEPIYHADKNAWEVPT